MTARTAVVIPGGGAGSRMGGVRKPFVEIAGMPMLAHTLKPFLANGAVEWVIVALAAEDAAVPPEWLMQLDPRIRVVAGGRERSDSVRCALAAVPEDAAVILVHDAARPLVSSRLVQACIDAAAAGRCVVAAVPVTDTIQQVDDTGRIVGTPDRGTLRAAQTPQAFPRAVLADAYQRAADTGMRATDDASVVVACGVRVDVIEGDADNIKVTTRADLDTVQRLLERTEQPAGTTQHGGNHG